MVRPEDRRQASKFLRSKGLSFRLTSRILGVPRSCLKLRPQRHIKENQNNLSDDVLIEHIKQVLKGNTSYGYRMVAKHLKRKGLVVNKKRVHRVWKHMGLQCPRRLRSKKIRTGNTMPFKAKGVNHIWCMDFIFDKTISGQTLKFLVIKDEFTRELVKLSVGTNFKSADVVEGLQQAFAVFGIPEFLRSDNGSEFVALELQATLVKLGVTSKFIAPGKPWRTSPRGAVLSKTQNGYVEGFNSRFRAEFLNQHLFHSIEHTRVLCDSYREYFNNERLHSSLGYCPPSEFRAGLNRGTKMGLALID